MLFCFAVGVSLLLVTYNSIRERSHRIASSAVWGYCTMKSFAKFGELYSCTFVPREDYVSLASRAKVTCLSKG